MGDELCTKCQFEEDVIRWQEAALQIFDPDDYQADLKLRREKLWRAKYHVHKAVEILFRGLEISTEAVWGHIRKDAEAPPIKLKKAA